MKRKTDILLVLTEAEDQYAFTLLDGIVILELEEAGE